MTIDSPHHARQASASSGLSGEEEVASLCWSLDAVALLPADEGTSKSASGLVSILAAMVREAIEFEREEAQTSGA